MLERLETERERSARGGPKTQGRPEEGAKMRRNALAALINKTGVEICKFSFFSYATTSTLASVLYKKASWEVLFRPGRAANKEGCGQQACASAIIWSVKSATPTPHQHSLLTFSNMRCLSC